MKVYISIDMEGVAGIATLDQTVRGGSGYPRAQQLMTGEANAAIEGAFAAGASEVTINDSHGTMDNLLHDELDPRASVVFGSPKAQCMAEGLSANHDVALFVGYHAPAGGPGTLSHTFSGLFTEVRLNGVPVSEADVNALLAGAMGVPIGLVSGDDVTCELATTAFPGVVTVPVKTSRGWSAAQSLAPSLARDAIFAGAKRALESSSTLIPISVPQSLVLDVDMPTITAAELAESVPGAYRVGSRTVRCDLASPEDVLGMISVCYDLVHAGIKALFDVVNRR